MHLEFRDNLDATKPQTLNVSFIYRSDSRPRYTHTEADILRYEDGHRVMKYIL